MNVTLHCLARRCALLGACAFAIAGCTQTVTSHTPFRPTASTAEPTHGAIERRLVKIASGTSAPGDRESAYPSTRNDL